MPDNLSQDQLQRIFHADVNQAIHEIDGIREAGDIMVTNKHLGHIMPIACRSRSLFSPVLNFSHLNRWSHRHNGFRYESRFDEAESGETEASNGRIFIHRYGSSQHEVLRESVACFNLLCLTGLKSALPDLDHDFGVDSEFLTRQVNDTLSCILGHGVLAAPNPQMSTRPFARKYQRDGGWSRQDREPNPLFDNTLDGAPLILSLMEALGAVFDLRSGYRHRVFGLLSGMQALADNPDDLNPCALDRLAREIADVRQEYGSIGDLIDYWLSSLIVHLRHAIPQYAQEQEDTAVADGPSGVMDRRSHADYLPGILDDALAMLDDVRSDFKTGCHHGYLMMALSFLSDAFFDVPRLAYLLRVFDILRAAALMDFMVSALADQFAKLVGIALDIRRDNGLDETGSLPTEIVTRANVCMDGKPIDFSFTAYFNGTFNVISVGDSDHKLMIIPRSRRVDLGRDVAIVSSPARVARNRFSHLDENRKQTFWDVGVRFGDDAAPPPMPLVFRKV